MTSRIILLFALTLFVADTATGKFWQRPGNRNANWEVGLQTRYVGAYSNDAGSGSALSIDRSRSWGFALGCNVNPHFNFGAAFTWRSSPRRGLSPAGLRPPLPHSSVMDVSP